MKFFVLAATFGWLCVETSIALLISFLLNAATFGWLCVETASSGKNNYDNDRQPPSGGCVLKLSLINERYSSVTGSHLRVAVC